MAIQTVTQANLAEFAASRPKASEISSPEALAASVAKAEPAKAEGDGAERKPTPGNPVITSGEEKLDTGAPDPGAQPKAEEKSRQPKPVQPRIDELVREKKELDEAFQEEYEQRLRLEGELAALRSQQQPKAEEKPKVTEDPRPDRTKYEDPVKYEDDLLAWNRREARREFEAEQSRSRREQAAREAEAAMAAKVAKAMADFPDFQEVIDKADRRTRGDIPAHIKAAMYESDVGAHIAYHLAKNPDEEKRIFALPVAKALLELGKIEDKLAKKPSPASGSTTETPATPAPPETKSTPAPIARLRESPGVVATDLSKPMSFKDYRTARLEQIRASGRKRH